MLSPAVKTSPPMGQQISAIEEGPIGQEVRLANCQGNGAPADRTSSTPGLDRGRRTDEPATGDGGLCMKDKIDHLIENYLLDTGEKDVSADNGKDIQGHSDGSLSKNNEGISIKSFANERSESDTPSEFVKRISEVVMAKNDSLSLSSKPACEDIKFSEGSPNKSLKDNASAIETSASSAFVRKLTEVVQAKSDAISTSKAICDEEKGDMVNSNEGIKTINKSNEDHPGRGDNRSTEESNASLDSSQLKNVTTIQTLIETVLDSNLEGLNEKNEKSNILEQCMRTEAPANVVQNHVSDSGCRDIPISETKSQSNLQQRQSNTNDDMSIPKQKIMCFKDHIEKLLTKNCKDKGQRDDTNLTETKEQAENHSDEGQPSDSRRNIEAGQSGQRPNSDSNGFNAQEMVDSVIIQTKVVNKLLSPSKDNASKGETNNQQEGESGVSDHNQDKNVRSEGDGAGDSLRHSEHINQAVEQSMARLQPHVEETVANLGRKTNEESIRDSETSWKERHDPIQSYPKGCPQERPVRQHIPYSVDKTYMQYSVRPNHAFQGASSSVAISAANKSPKEGMPSRYPNNSHYPYPNMHSPNLNRQLSPRQPVPQQLSPRQPSQQLSPRQLSPSVASQMPKLSPVGDGRTTFGIHHTSPHHAMHVGNIHNLPASFRDHASHTSNQFMLRDQGGHTSVHQMSPRDVASHGGCHQSLHDNGVHHTSPQQISLRDCQCTSCDNRHSQKQEQKDGLNTIEYVALKPGHISNGSPYHSVIPRPPVPEQISPHQKPLDRDANLKMSVSSAMAPGPAPPSSYYQPQYPFKMPQLYPSNPPISSPREYRLDSQNSPGAMPQNSPHGSHPSVWKASSEQKQLSPSLSQYSSLAPQKLEANSLPYPPAQPSPHHPQQFKREGLNKGDNYWPKVERTEIPNHESPYSSHKEVPDKPKELVPVLDLSVKKKEENSESGDQPLDLTCKRSKSDGSALRGNSVRSNSSFSANDMKFDSPSRNTLIHQLVDTVDKLCKERKSPATSYNRGRDGQGFLPHAAERQSSKQAFPAHVRGQEYDTNQPFNTKVHHGSQEHVHNNHRQDQGHREGSAYPMVPPPLMPAVYRMPYSNASQIQRISELSPRVQMTQAEMTTRHQQTPAHVAAPVSQQQSQNYQHQSLTSSQHYSQQSHQSQNPPPPPQTVQQTYPHQAYSQQSSHHQHHQQQSAQHLQQQQQLQSLHQQHHQSLPSHQQPSHTHHQPTLPTHPQPPHPHQQQMMEQQQHQQFLPPNRQESSSPSLNGQSRLNSKRSNVSKHEPIQNIIGNHSPNDILYLVCRLCLQTYGSLYSFRKHFRNQHGFEPRAEHTTVETISAKKRSLNAPPPPTGPYHVHQAALQQIPQRHPLEPASLAPVLPRPPAVYVSQQPPHNIPIDNTVNQKSKAVVREHPVTNSDSLQVSDQTKSVKDKNQSSIKDRATPNSGQSEESSQDNKRCNTNDRSPTEQKRMECPECGQTFQLNDFGLFKRHCRQHGQPKIPRPLAPNEGQMSFSDQVSSSHDLNSGPVGAHMETVCKFCSLPFATPAFLSDHISSAHPEKVKNEEKCSNSKDLLMIKPATPSVVQKVPAESATVSVSPDSSCEPQSIQDGKVSESYEHREMPVLKKQISTTSSNSENVDSKSTEEKDTKGDNNSDTQSTKSPESIVLLQISSESGSLLDNGDEKSCDFSVDNVSYMHKKFSSHRNKRKNSMLSADTTINKQLRISSDVVSSAKSPGSVNSPSAYSSNSYDSETSNMMEITCVETTDGDRNQETDRSEDKHSSKTEARHQLPFVWDRVTRSQAVKNVRRQDYH